MTESTTCLIAGGGPAGIMLGLLLARAGVEVTVLEKHGDFLRDFRGDTVHASTLHLLAELGLADRFERIPHSRLADYRLPVDHERSVLLGDFSRLPKPYDYIAMAPQWDLLSMLAAAASEEATFTLRMNTEALEPIIEGDRVVGVRARCRDDHDHENDHAAGHAVDHECEIRADLTVACDGRNSVLRDRAGLVPRQHEVPYDVWWFRLSRNEREMAQPPTLLPSFARPDVLLAMTREDYHQLAFLAPKGSEERIRAEGIEAFRRRIARLRPDFADRLDELTSMDEIPLLKVQLNRLHRWHRPGLLCIGDAAHAMSPSGGVGVNLAIQDAVAAARYLAGPLLAGTVSDDDLDRVRRRRLWPTVLLQTGQRLLHKTIYEPVFAGRFGGFELVLTALRVAPWLARPAGRLIAIGPRPEHAPDFARRARAA